MGYKINRAELLSKLQAVQPGLANNDRMIEQANCFIFKAGRVCCYNDNVATTIPSGLPEEVVGAIPAVKFIGLLSKLTEEDVELDWNESEVIVKGRKGRESGFRLEADIHSQIDSIEQPEEWKPLPDNFGDAVAIVQECAGNVSSFITNVINIHPKWMEAGDDTQAIRYKIKTGITNPTMIRQGAIKHVSGLGMTEFAETASWLHFRNPTGLVYSCRAFIDPPYSTDEITEALKDKTGHPMSLPKGLVDAVDLVENAMAGDKQGKALIELLPGDPTGVLWIKGQGQDGCWHKEPKKIVYAGTPLSFLISPKLLKEIVEKHNEALISENKMRIDGGKWVWMSVLGATEPQKTNGEVVVEVNEE